MNSERTILVTGAAGQLGLELTSKLRDLHGTDNVIATDIRKNLELEVNGPFELLDVLDAKKLKDLTAVHNVGCIYHLAAILSALGEKRIDITWKLNMDGLLNVLETARLIGDISVFWPSSIAVFGPDARRQKTPQDSPLNPTTVYGISKAAGELWCAYYHRRYGVDARSVRYPGLVSKISEPGGGTTDYAVEIFRTLHKNEAFVCPLDEGTCLPMMYMSDAVKAAIELMAAKPETIRTRTSYNISATSFTPGQLTEAIRKHHPKFDIRYAPDHRDDIASSWPDSIDDQAARNDWNWKADFDLDALVTEMLRISVKQSV